MLVTNNRCHCCLLATPCPAAKVNGKNTRVKDYYCCVLKLQCVHMRDGGFCFPSTARIYGVRQSVLPTRTPDNDLFKRGCIFALLRFLQFQDNHSYGR